MGTHSKLFSPSGSHRWLNCPGSAELCAKYPDTTSEAAADGIMKHDFCEKNIQGYIKHPELIEYSGLMEPEIHQVKLAMDMVANIMATNEAVIVAIEYENGRILGMPELYGTVDLVLYSKVTKELFVIDYKFGYNEVKAEMNTQLLIYAALACGVMKDGLVENITIGIVQPKINEKKPDLYSLTKKELDNWVRNELSPKYDGISNGQLKNHFVPGEEQCRWCKAKAECPEIRKEISDALNTDISDNTNIGYWLEKVKMIRDWCSDIESTAIAQMQEGKIVSGYKLVRGRSNRRWVDPEKADKWLAARRFKADERRDYKVIGIPKAEKLISGLELSTKLKNSFERLIEKPEGKITYAKEDDPRSPIIVENVTNALNSVDTEIEDLL